MVVEQVKRYQPRWLQALQPFTHVLFNLYYRLDAVIPVGEEASLIKLHQWRGIDACPVRRELTIGILNRYKQRCKAGLCPPDVAGGSYPRSVLVYQCRR